MQICSFFGLDPKKPRLGLVREGLVYDLEALGGREYSSFASFISLADPIQDLSMLLADRPLSDGKPLAELDVQPSNRQPHLLAPIDQQEVWAAGVTYVRSKSARMAESQNAATIYDRVYDAQRPELFYKADARRTSGPNAPVRIRKDSAWNVPEPELALVLSPGLELIGVTAGNDMSSRDIEGENPLYLPQAKVYSQCCALGPVVTLMEPGFQPEELEIEVSIERSGKAVFSGGTNTRLIKRPFAELIEYLGRDNEFPHGVILLTGTGIVPPNDFTLLPGDLVSISIQGIGTLRNPVVQG
ncbi:MAG: fumarylacetoacetate hydrolase family protein [Deltaproteobacteria bacterium]|nr:fumarylacetoacetate hydrolase family protein [Deltaproteobacteria bacterium]